MPRLLCVFVAAAVSSAAATRATTSCHQFPNTDFDGHDTHKVDAQDPNSCCDACTADDSCTVWTFMPPSTCYFKNSNAGQRTMKGYTSGCTTEDSCKPPPPPPPHGNGYGCDPFGGERGVCVNGYGNFTSSDCDGTCGDPDAPAKFHCETDWNCSLAGVCHGDHCKCDAWATGVDCSYVNFQPVNRSALGYIDPTYSSWGGNAIKASDGNWHLFMAEIGPAGRQGLGHWTSQSQIAHAVSQAPDGPYTRKALVAAPEHHNPTLQKSPVDGSWNLYSISAGSGPIVMSTSIDEGQSWSSTSPGTKVSDEQNPGPRLWNNGSMTMWYRDDASTSSPCSSESIGVQYCTGPNAICSGGVNPVFSHTSEDPSVFVDKRGHYHMLTNALPGGCKPKLLAGGHAWSMDGITWSEPRIGAFNTTIQFTDGSNMTCGRRERPQMVMDPDTGDALVMFSGITGCPLVPGTPYKGGSDCFTLAQKVVQEQ